MRDARGNLNGVHVTAVEEASELHCYITADALVGG